MESSSRANFTEEDIGHGPPKHECSIIFEHRCPRHTVAGVAFCHIVMKDRGVKERGEGDDSRVGVKDGRLDAMAVFGSTTDARARYDGAAPRPDLKYVLHTVHDYIDH